MADSFQVRPMFPEDIPEVNRIWKDTGLAEGTGTVATWFRFDPNGFYVTANQQGLLYGMCAAVVLNDDLAFLGLYAVRPQYQGRGIGVKMWRKAMEHIGNRNAGLNSVPEHLRTYRDLAGFRIVTKWQTVVCESNEFSTEHLTHCLTGTEVQIIDDTILPGVILYDESIHGYNRSKIVKLSVNEQDSYAMVALQQDGDREVCGYGCLKKNVQGSVMVGPLYADSRDIAESILLKLLSSFPHAQENGLTIMIVDCNKDALILVEKLGLKMKTEIPRCYLKEEVNVAFHKVFGQHALNFSTF